ncbi:MAG TPA: hypothetical protein VKT74_08690 [Gammaproteobacteria bacterium]|nr:hypothetical protein [Gammaproteobacteria bacterium]
MIRVTAVSHYFAPLSDGEPLPSLDAAVREVCVEPYRRIDRFVQLALLGSGRCAAGRALATDCGLYMGSGLGPMGSNVLTQEQLGRDREAPMPFNFINTLGSSAGFYVGKNLKLSGQNFFVSRRGANLTALLNMAMADLELGVVKQALLGVVEEATQPLEDHRLRQHLPADRTVAEGSHWLLLEKDATTGRTLGEQRFAEPEALDAALKRAWRPGDRLVDVPRMEEKVRGALRKDFASAIPDDPREPFHDSLDAAHVTAALAADAVGSVFMVEGEPGRGYGLFHFRA